jgi:hypothetical protein
MFVLVTDHYNSFLINFMKILEYKSIYMLPEKMKIQELSVYPRIVVNDWKG